MLDAELQHHLRYTAVLKGIETYENHRADLLPDGNLSFYREAAVGIGTSYVPEALSRRAVFGLSLMSFSNPISQGFEIVQTNPTISTTPSYLTPAQINFAVDYSIFSKPLFDVTLSLGFTKSLDKMEDVNRYVAQSSVTSLFTDWNDFPQDVTTHVGLGYLWKPQSPGGGISYFQDHSGDIRRGGTY